MLIVLKNLQKNRPVNEDWMQDMEYLCGDNYKIKVVKVYTQALIHSNLFDA